MTTMPNLPVIPDLALFTTEVNRSSLTQADTSCALTSELAIEQAFGDILATLSTSTHEESDLPNPDSGTETNTIDNQEPKFVDPLTVSVIPIPIDQWINPPQPIPDISATELLSTSPRNTILNANQPITEKPIIFTETENNLLSIDATNENRLISNTTLTSPNNADQTIDLAPLIADQKIQPPSAVTTIWVHANSTTEQSNTDKTAILTQDSSLPFEQQSSRNRDINNIAPLSANHVNQAADAANFTDNGKILPSSTTFVATTHPKLNLSINIANTTASNTSTIIASSSPKPKFVDPLTINMLPTSADQWVNQPQSVLDTSTAKPYFTLSKGIILNSSQPITGVSAVFTENNLLSSESPNISLSISNTVSISTNSANQTTNLESLTADQEIQSHLAEATILMYANSTTEQSNADKTAIPTQDSSLPFEQQSSRNRDTSNIAPLSANHVNQAADAANFTDNGKILPSSTTFVATTHPKLNLSINIANTTASNTSTIIASSSPKPKFVDPLTISMLPTSTDQWINQSQSVLDNSIGTVDTLMNNTPTITTEFGQPNWPDEFGQKITWLATQRIQTAELKLHPAHLGPIEISLQLSDDKQLTAQFISHHAIVRETIEANLPKLREIMATNGITLSDASVSADTSQQQAGNGRGDSAHTTRNYYFSSALSSPISMHTSTLLITGQHSGIIDTFA